MSPGADAAVTSITDTVRAVDPRLSVAVIDAAVDRVAPTPNRRTRLRRFLTELPDPLTSGSSRLPKLVGLFVADLVAAGATGMVVPRCADCGEPKELFHTRGDDRICRGCFEKSRAGSSVCGGCGKPCRPRGRGSDGSPRCQACQHKARTVACSRCGRIRPVNYSRADGKPYCRGCRARNHLETCRVCGNLRPVNVRDPDGRAVCGSCYTARHAPREPCAECGTTAAVAKRRSDGAAVCARCYDHPTRTCGVCGRTRRVALRGTITTPDICPTCYQAPKIICSVCGTTDLGRRATADGKPMCFRCQATRRVDTVLAGPDGQIPESLLTLRDAIVAADNPRSTLANLTRNKSLALLASIARGDKLLSHDTLDEQAGRYSIEHLRALLVAAAALPARDEHMIRLQRYAADLAAAIDHPDDRRTVAAFTRWHVMARLRHRTTGDLTANAAHRCRAELAAAARFLAFLRDRSRDLAGCRQADIDAWFADSGNGDASRVFLIWAQRQRHLTNITLPAASKTQPSDFTPENDRWALANRMLHDSGSASIADRVAACLVLLYAQPVARIVALTRAHVRIAPDDTLQVRLGHTDVAVLAPLDRLLTQLPEASRRGTAARLGEDEWLFPGRRPGQHLHAISLARRIAAVGVDPRADRNGALLTLARQLPPAVIGKLLGLHPVTAVNWSQLAGSDWGRYAAQHSRRKKAIRE